MFALLIFDSTHAEIPIPYSHNYNNKNIIYKSCIKISGLVQKKTLTLTPNLINKNEKLLENATKSNFIVKQSD